MKYRRHKGSLINPPVFGHLNYQIPFFFFVYDLQEIPWGNTDFSWFTDVSYLKGDNGTFCSGYGIATPFDVLRQHLYFRPTG